MKKYFLIFPLVLGVISLFAQKLQGDSWAKVKAQGKGTLTMIYYEQPGLIYESNGKIKGVCEDIIEDFVAFVKKKYNKEITLNYAVKEPIFSNFMRTVQNTDDILGVTNVTVTDERKRILKFTPSFMSNPVVMITHKDAPTISSASEIPTKLAGYSAEMISGSTHIRHMDKIKKEIAPSIQVTYGPSGSEIIKKITTNPKLFTILDLTEYIDAARKQLPVKRQNISFGAAEQLAFIMSKGSDWDEIWKEFLTEDYRRSVKYRKNIADNLGANFLSLVK
jgi:ABC-type amino acid transport substrate-binding protein